MRTRKLGRTGLDISEITFGAGWVGGLMIHQTDDVKQAALQAMQKAGVNWLDTAASYGDGQSESAIGRLLPGMDYDPYVSTKIRLDPDSRDVMGDIEAGVTASLTRLNRSNVTLLQLHNQLSANPRPGRLTPQQVIGSGGVADCFRRLQQQGLFDYFGFTALGESGICRQIIESEAFDTAQIYYNMLNPSAGRAMPGGWPGQDFQNLLQAASDHGVGVMNIRVFAAGALVAPEPHGREVPISDAAGVAEEYRRGAAAAETFRDQTDHMAQMCLRHSFAEPRISTVVIGVADLDHVALALSAAEQPPLPETLIQRLDKLYANGFAAE